MIQNCFLAIPLDPPNILKFTALLEELKRLGLTLRFQRAVSAHVTLIYFGTMRDSKSEKMIPAIQAITAAHRPFDITIKEVGTFGSTRHPRVVWKNPEQSAALDTLQENLKNTFATMFTVRDKRPFHAHLTIARIDSAGKYLEKKGAAQSLLESYEFSQHVDRLRLYVSDQAAGEFQVPVMDFQLGVA